MRYLQIAWGSASGGPFDDDSPRDSQGRYLAIGWLGFTFTIELLFSPTPTEDEGR